jgi:hypothetical protein
MKINLLLGISFLSISAVAQTTVKDTLFYTGGEQSWTVPCGASNVIIDTYGAKGAPGSTINPSINSGGRAGLGNRVTGNWSFLVPGDEIHVFVGGSAVGATGGYNGGGNGVAIPSANPSGGGGGATDIRFPSNALSDRIQVAGGGGGGGNAGLHASNLPFTAGNGGDGGGNQLLYGNSLDGTDGAGTTSGSDFSGGAGGGSASAFGLAGDGCPTFLGSNGSSGTSGQGANGGQGNNGFGLAQTDMAPSGGAGGGGYIGGNSGGGGSAGSNACGGDNFGAGGGGAAGSNYFDGPPSDFTNGVNDGAGYVVITYILTIDTAEIDENFTIPCVGESVIIWGSPGNGTYNVLSGPAADMNDGELTPSMETAYVITYSKTICGITTTDTVTVVVDCTLGLNENSLNSLTIYPNPTNAALTIENALNANIRIYDNTGKVVKTINNNQAPQISVSELVEGLYFIDLEKEGIVQTARFIKE